MWEPISENELLQLIDSAEIEMKVKFEIERFWNRIKIKPQKWMLPPWTDEGDGFWVVAIIGQQCIWYNDIEEGFNISEYSHLGYVDNYYCNQDELNFCVHFFYRELIRDLTGIASDEPIGFLRLGSPEPFDKG